MTKPLFIYHKRYYVVFKSLVDYKMLNRVHRMAFVQLNPGYLFFFLNMQNRPLQNTQF